MNNIYKGQKTNTKKTKYMKVRKKHQKKYMQKGQKTNTKKGKKYKGQKTNTRKKKNI